MEQGIKSGASVEAVGKALDLLLNHVEGCLQICPYLLTFPPVGVLQLYMGHKTQIHSAHCAPHMGRSTCQALRMAPAACTVCHLQCKLQCLKSASQVLGHMTCLGSLEQYEH